MNTWDNVSYKKNLFVLVWPTQPPPDLKIALLEIFTMVWILSRNIGTVKSTLSINQHLKYLDFSVSDSPVVFQPLVPPPVPIPKIATTTSYNISFPTTLQPRDRFDIWRNQSNINQYRYGSETTGSSCGSSIAHSPGGSSVTVS